MLPWLDRIDRGECQTEESVIAGVLGELIADLLRELNSLIGECRLTNGDGVSVHIAAGAASVTIGDVPRIALKLLRGVGLGWVIYVMAVDLISRSLRREDPAMPLSAYDFQID